ncbi:MAG TPA: calcium/proton exchanger [Methylococcaceae bacterium]|jgi:Ca2+:H+ antiporter|nr:calcium/proton exchanger [Methylococcaceae bacterium]
MKLNWLLLFIPVGIGLAWYEVNPIVVFLTSALAIIPLAGLMGDATEALAKFLGPTLGGLLNATLGNAPEIIIGLFALKQGLVEMVKASITGAIVGNLLFGLGLSVFVGGLKFPKLTYDIQTARVNGQLLMLATFGLIVPAVFNFSTASEREISLEISIALFLIYLASIVYTLFSGKPTPGEDAAKPVSPPMERPTETSETQSETEATGWSRNKALGILAAVTVALAVMSEILTDAVDPAAKNLGLTPLFAGVFLLALVGNTADLINSVRFARQNQLNISIGITVGSSTQMALLVAPILVFFGFVFGRDMNLLFSPFELVAIIMPVVVFQTNANIGTAVWLGGLMLITIYFMLGFGFYYAPATAGG